MHPIPDLSPFILRHVSGGRRGSEDRFQADRVTIGRGRNNHCSFDAEKDRSVSHRHCEVRLENDQHVLYDMGSLNGTYVNGRRVRRMALVDGDEIGLGREGPRMRFVLHGGEAASPFRPPPGATAEERRPHWTPDRPSSTRRRPALWIAFGILAAGSGAWLLTHLIHRVGQLEQQRTGGDGPAKIESSEYSMGQVPTGPRGAVVKILGVLRDEAGRLVTHESLGFGSIVRPQGVVTTGSVADTAAAWLRRPAQNERMIKTVEAAPAGVLDASRAVLGYIPHPNPRGEDDNLSLLVLSGDQPWPRVGSGKLEGAERLTFFPPFESDQHVTVRRFLSPGRQTAVAGEAALMAFDADPSAVAPPSGMPLFSGANLVGMALGGDGATGWAITARAIEEFLSHTSLSQMIPFESR